MEPPHIGHNGEYLPPGVAHRLPKGTSFVGFLVATLCSRGDYWEILLLQLSSIAIGHMDIAIALQ